MEECSRCARVRNLAGGDSGGGSGPGGKSGVGFGPAPGRSCCIQQIEVRKDGSLSTVPEDQEMDWEGSTNAWGQWSERERRLRRLGVVVWRPINLHVGDVEGKTKVVEQWEVWRELRDRREGKGGWMGKNWAPPARLAWMRTESDRELRRMREELVRGYWESKEDEERRLRQAEATVTEWDQDDIELAIHRPEGEPNLEKEQDVAELKKSVFDHIPQLDMHIAKQKDFWRLRIQAEKIHKHDADIEQRNFQAAMKRDAAWLKEAEFVLAEVEDWLEVVLRGQADGASKQELSRSADKKLSPGTREWMCDLIPRIWDIIEN